MCRLSAKSRLASWSSVRDSALMLGATSLTSLLHYAFSLVMGRMLGPADYSIMSALMGVYVVVSIPVTVISTVVAKSVSGRLAQGKESEIGGVIWQAWKQIVLYGGGIVLLLLMLSPWLSRFLQIDAVRPVIAMISIILPALALFAARGCLQGLQRFGALAANTVLEATLRLGSGIALVSLKLEASGGLLALTCSCLGAMGVAIWSLLPYLRRRAASKQETGMARYFFLTLAGYLAFAVLTNTDMILVRHFFPPQAAGEYAAAATLGKIALFLPAPMATVMFPKTALRNAQRQETTSVLSKSAAVTLILCAIPVIGMFILPQHLVGWSYGQAYIGGAGLLGIYGASMAGYALVSLLLQYFLSVDDMRFITTLAIGAVLSLLGISAFHTSASQVVTVMGIIGGLMIATGCLLCLYPRPARQTA